MDEFLLDLVGGGIGKFLDLLLVVGVLLEVVEQLAHDALDEVLSVDSLCVLVDYVDRVGRRQGDSVRDCKSHLVLVFFNLDHLFLLLLFGLLLALLLVFALFLFGLFTGFLEARSSAWALFLLDLGDWHLLSWHKHTDHSLFIGVWLDHSFDLASFWESLTGWLFLNDDPSLDFDAFGD